MFRSLQSFRLAVILSLTVGAAAAWAQEPATEPDAPTDQPADQSADQGRRGDRGPGFGGRGGRGGGMDRMLGMVPLLRVETVRQELGVNEEQSKSIETTTLAIREEFGQQFREFMQSFRDLSPEDRQAQREERDGRLSELRNKVNERLQGVLDEGQFRRLKEIEVQRSVRSEGVGSLTSGEIAAALDLSDDQKQQLREQGQAAEDQREPLSLDDVRAKVKDILTPDQMGKLEALFGKAFDLPREMLQRGRGRFGGGGFGGRGRGGEGRQGLRQRPQFEDEAPAAGDTSVQQ